MAKDTAVYTHGHHASVLRSHTWRTAANSARYLLSSLTERDRVLDVGCGPGTLTVDLATHVPQGEVVGVDQVAGILDQAREHAKDRGITNVRFEKADVYELPYADDSFDVVHAHQVLQHISDPVAALQEMRRVCRPGGVVAARDADYSAMSWYPRPAGLDTWLELYRRVARANGGEPDAGPRLKSWALEAGFVEVTGTAGVWCWSSPEEIDWWSGLWAERTQASAYAERALDGGHTDRAGLEAVSAAWREWGSTTDAWFAVVHGEIVCQA